MNPKFKNLKAQIKHHLCLFALQTSSSGIGGKKPGRCKFCRSKAKYIPGQRSFDAAGIFGRRREQREPRRTMSEDQPRDPCKKKNTFFAAVKMQNILSFNKLKQAK